MTAPARTPRSADGGDVRERDLRDWITEVEGIGELRTVRGASWQADIGAVTEMLDHADNSPCVLFDEVPGYPAGRRVVVNCNGTTGRQAVTLGLPAAQASHQGLFDFWRAALTGLQPIPPRTVTDAPVLENRLTGTSVDLEAFPVPVWHPKDGGRYIGTASMNILRDPDSDWVNVATYRNQIFERDELGVYISPGKHGRQILDRYIARGERCPIALVFGMDPLLFMAACAEGIAYGESELGWAGGIRGRAVEVVPGPITGLPIPASAEIAVEGWIDPVERRAEGPYGEWQGYYSLMPEMTPVIHVEAIYHRTDPILMGCPQGKPPHEDNRFLAYLKSALVEDQLRKAGVPKVTGVWCPPEAGNRLMVVVGIDQAYPGHAIQVGLVAGQVGTTAYGGRYVVVVDSDIDIFSIHDVLWALTTRCDPRRDTTIIDRAWSSPVDPAIKPEERGFNSRLIFDATRPWEWRDRFSEPVVTADMARATKERWGWLLQPGLADRPTTG